VLSSLYWRYIKKASGLTGGLDQDLHSGAQLNGRATKELYAAEPPPPLTLVAFSAEPVYAGANSTLN
jgi:hypothetical protein